MDAERHLIRKTEAGRNNAGLPHGAILTAVFVRAACACLQLKSPTMELLRMPSTR